MAIKKIWSAFVGESPGNSTWILNIVVSRYEWLLNIQCRSLALISPLFSLCSQVMGWNPKAGCDGEHLQSAGRRMKEQIRTVNMQHEEKFHPASSPGPSCGCGWSLPIPFHPCIVPSSQLSHARPLPLLQPWGAGTSALYPHAPPVIPLYPSSSPSLAQLSTQLLLDRTPVSSMRVALGFMNFLRKCSWMNLKPQGWARSC